MTDITRAVAIRRGLRNLDICHSVGAAAFELELARAYDAGHIVGSGVKHQTDAEQRLAEVARQLTGYQIHLITETVSPELGAALLAVLPASESRLECGEEACRGCGPQRDADPFVSFSNGGSYSMGDL